MLENLNSKIIHLKFSVLLPKKMHELSIATSIIEIAEEFAVKNKGANITKIEIEVGELSGIVVDSLEFAMELAVVNTVLERAKIIITTIKGMTRCKQCGKEYVNSDWYTACPQCASMDFDITGGKELQIKSIFIE